VGRCHAAAIGGKEEEGGSVRAGLGGLGGGAVDVVCVTGRHEYGWVSNTLGK